ncbi:MAG: BolA family protein [Burkholderiales bacterium]
MSDMPDRIRSALVALEPEHIAVRDDSALHAGHAGAREGGHYHVSIVSRAFAGRNRVARHRLVYDALGPLMKNGIHALALDARTPDEVGAPGGPTASH